MRAFLAVTLLCCACAEPPIDVGQQRAALSAPMKFASFDAGRPAQVGELLGLEHGVLQLVEEPWFIPVDGGAPVLLGDLVPGFRGSFAVTIPTAVDGRSAAFVARSTNRGPLVDAVWMTDGTFENTLMPFDGGVVALAGSSPLGIVVRVPVRAGIEGLRALRGQTVSPPFFEADAGFEAYDFQATPGGTVFVASGGLHRTDGGSSERLATSVASALVPLSGKVWFAGNEGAALRLFSSDGTPAGTARTPTPLTGISTMLPTASELALIADAPGSQKAVYFTDGTDAGTRQVSPAQLSLTLFGTTNTHAFFSVDGGTWSADGVAPATQVFPTLVRASTSTQQFRLATPTALYFTDAQGLPWVSDGTSAGTVQLLSAVSNAWGYAALDATRVLFFATVTAGEELFVTDGTPAGTRKLASFYRGLGDGIPAGAKLISTGGVTWFNCLTLSRGGGVCRTDGTTAGTELVPTRGRLVNAGTFLVRANQSLLIGTSPNLQVWSSTSGVASLPVRNNFLPEVDPNGGAWLLDILNADARLWHSDGTVAGTVNVGSVPGRPQMLKATPSAVFIGVGSSVIDAVYAWRPDAGATALPSTAQRTPALFTTWGDELAWAGESDAGEVVFASNGATTRLAVNPTPSVTNDYVRDLVEFGGELHFSLLGPTGTSLVRALSDGGVEELVPVTSSSSGRWVRAGANLYAVGLFSFGRWNPTTSSLEPLATWTTRATSVDVKRVGDGLILVVNLFVSPRQSVVWATDGTSAGTRQLNGFFEDGNAPSLLHVAGRASDDVFFPSWTRERGLEPGVLVGTSSSVTPLPELCPGACSSITFFAEPVIVGDTLYFLAEDETPNTVNLFASDLNVASPGGGAGGGGVAQGGGSAAGGGTGGAGGGGAAQGGGSAAGGGTGGGGGGDASGGGAGGGGNSTAAGCTCATTTGWGWGLVLFALVGRRRQSTQSSSRSLALQRMRR